MLVFYSDFTYLEGAVSSMYGMVKGVDRSLDICDPSFDKARAVRIEAVDR